MGLVNAEQICEARILDFSPYPHYEYREAEKSIINGNRKAGFYNTLSLFGERMITVDEIEKDGQMICVGKQVFWRPRIFLKMSNGDRRYMYFESLEEATTRFNNDPNFSHIKWIEDVYE